MKALNAAWVKFSAGKRSRRDVMAFEKHLGLNIRKLHNDLTRGCYRHGRYVDFIVQDPKRREIRKATVRDRVVHQAIVTALEPIFERSFIYDSYSCRVGKGTHAAVLRLRRFLNRVSRNNTVKVYALKCDIKQFFASIDHEILMGLIESRICDERISALLREVLLSHGSDLGRGLPLGNVTSQLFANVYLHELDFFVKFCLRERYYLRYCDDFLILGTDRNYLESLIPFLAQKITSLHLSLHPDKVVIRPYSQGIDFLGYVLRPHSMTLRTKTKNRALKRVSQTNLPSYLGLCSHADANQIARTLQHIAWERDPS